MQHATLRIIRNEHMAVAAVLRSLRMMLHTGPGDEADRFFDVLRAMLFYIDEFPERLHHPKETQLLFPKLRERAPTLSDVLQKLDSDHAYSEHAVRELQHMVMAWELLGDSRRAPFEQAAQRYIDNYLEHMHLEETELLPMAERHFDADDWKTLDAAFSSHYDPLASTGPREPTYERLFTRIVLRAPAPIGVGSPNSQTTR